MSSSTKSCTVNRGAPRPTTTPQRSSAQPTTLPSSQQMLPERDWEGNYSQRHFQIQSSYHPSGGQLRRYQSNTAHEQELTHLVIRAPVSVSAKECAPPTQEAKPHRRKTLIPGMRPRMPAGQRAWGVTRAWGARERGLHWKLHQKNDALPLATWQTELTSSRRRREELVIATYINEAKGKRIDIHSDGVGGTSMGKSCNHTQYCVVHTEPPSTCQPQFKFSCLEAYSLGGFPCGSPSRREHCTSALCGIEVVRKDMAAFYLILSKGHPVIDHEDCQRLGFLWSLAFI